jgi:5'-3' exoribonuclease 1
MFCRSPSISCQLLRSASCIIPYFDHHCVCSWLSERYPLINQPLDENTLLPEIDNLYLDLNGTIHNATHGDGMAKKLSEHDVMLSVMSSIDGAVQLTRPKKLLYMAVDGCAPRAKMNQQRSRRFRAARDLEEARTAAVTKGEEIKDEEVSFPFESKALTFIAATTFLRADL